jgi:energy-coupling factor transporter ATP-binding protein EcfA2
VTGEPAVQVRGLTFYYQGASEPALSDVDLVLERGEIAALVGPTGAGKSTLFMALTGLIPHHVRGRMAGSVTVAGMDTQTHAIAELAQRVGIVFQAPETQLFALSVRDELAFGPENLGLPKDEIRNRITDTAESVGLVDILDHEPAQMSGGQQQAVAIGSVLAMLPEVLVLDEPTSNLDPEGSDRVLTLIERLNRSQGKTILIAEHKIDDVAKIAQHVFVMAEGRIVLDGSRHSVFRQVDVLHALGVVAPTATEVAYALGKAGVPFDPMPVTFDEGVEAFGSMAARAASV